LPPTIRDRTARPCLVGAGALCAALAVGAVTHADSRHAPLWDVSGRWDGFNGAEYLVLRQHQAGRLDVTVHHTCAPGHIERGRGRIEGSRLRARVEPARKPQPAACVAFARIDVRVTADGRRMTGHYATDRDSGALLYLARRQARSLVSFRPRIARARGHAVRVLLRARPRLPEKALARVRLCGPHGCEVAHGRYGPLFRRTGRRCGMFSARVSFARSTATARRRLCP
jgi:hypothetical protein